MALVYISGYSEPMGHIKGDQLIDGIRGYRIGPDGRLSPASSPSSVYTAGLPNPSLVSSDPTGRFLFAIHEIDDGAVSAFAIDPGTGALSFLNRVSAHGSAPCHCCVDASGLHFFCASYASGTVTSFAIQPDGSLAPASQVVQHSNGDMKPHAHSVTMSPNNMDLIAVDLGLDQVRRYALSAATGAISLRQTLQMKQGLGSCLFTFGKTGKHAYVGNEYDSSVCHLTLEGEEDGFWTDGVRYNTAPPGKKPGVLATIDVHCSPCGRFLYASNTAYNCIAIFEIAPSTGRLKIIGHQDTLGDTPRQFSISPDGRWLLVCNQDSHTVVSFAIDKQSGLISPVEDGIVEVGSPTCVHFVAPATVAAL